MYSCCRLEQPIADQFISRIDCRMMPFLALMRLVDETCESSNGTQCGSMMSCRVRAWPTSPISPVAEATNTTMPQSVKTCPHPHKSVTRWPLHGYIVTYVSNLRQASFIDTQHSPPSYQLVPRHDGNR